MNLPLSHPTAAQRQGLILARTGASFQRCKDMALAALKSGDREGARFYAGQARADWRSICHQIGAH